jgi:hypothetical protein
VREPQKQFWLVATALAGILMLILTAWAMLQATPKPPLPEPEVTMFFSDSAGVPRTDIWLLLKEKRIVPNADGLVRVSRSRAGEEASIRDQGTRGELCALTIPQPSSEATRIIVPTKRTVRCR